MRFKMQCGGTRGGRRIKGDGNVITASISGKVKSGVNPPFQTTKSLAQVLSGTTSKSHSFGAVHLDILTTQKRHLSMSTSQML